MPITPIIRNTILFCCFFFSFLAVNFSLVYFYCLMFLQFSFEIFILFIFYCLPFFFLFLFCSPFINLCSELLMADPFERFEYVRTILFCSLCLLVFILRFSLFMRFVHVNILFHFILFFNCKVLSSLLNWK